LTDNFKHSVFLSALIIIGLGIAQLHELTHAAELFQVERDAGGQQDSTNHESEDCLVCTLTLSGFGTPTHSTSPDYSTKEKLTLPHYPFTKTSATKHIRLRAPPVLHIIS